MAQVIRGQLGKHVPIVLLSHEVRTDSKDGQLYHPRTVSIAHIKDPSGAIVLQNASPIMRREGEFVHHWDTSGRSAGDHEVACDWVIDSEGNTIRRTVIVRLVKQGAP